MAEAAKYPTEHVIRTRTIDAPVQTIFAVLSDPSRLQDTEPTDWVRDAIDGEPLTGTEMRLTSDRSRTTHEARDEFGRFPVVSPEYLDASLATLERTVTGVGGASADSRVGWWRD